MKKSSFGKTNLQVSKLGFGAAPIGFLKTEVDEVGKILNLLLDAGMNLIDTAAGYPGSEEAIAQTVGHRRKEFILVSKCGNKVSEIEAPAWSSELVSKTVDRSLKNLQTDHLDVMLLHSCSLDVLKQGDALKALVDAKKAGKIRHAGYSGDNEAAAYAATLSDIDVIETSVNVVDQANIDRVLPHCAENNIGVLAKRPIANAAWKPITDQPGMYQNYAKTYTERFEKMKIWPDELGYQYEKDWPEIALRFTLSFPEISSAIIGTTNPKNAQANIDAVNKGPFPADVVARIREAFKKAQGSDDWSGQT